MKNLNNLEEDALVDLIINELLADHHLHEIKVFLSKQVYQENLRRSLKELILQQRLEIKNNLLKIFQCYAKI